jgi:heptosyltransferase-2
VESVLECPEAYHKKQVCVNFQLDIKKIEKDLAQEFWIENNLDNKRVVVIAPGSVQPHKKWPVEKYKKIVMSLLEDDQIRIVISGTKNDKAIGEEIHSCNPDKIIDLTGNTSVQELAAILEKTDLLIGNDGGTMHLGDAVGTNVISIVPGLEYPNSIEPFHNIKNSLRHYTECYPCYSFMSCPNGHNKCMLDISVQDVMNKAKDILYNGENLRAPFNGRIFKVDRKKGSIRFSEINI